VANQPLVIADEFQPVGPRRTLHGRGAPAQPYRDPRHIAFWLVRCTLRPLRHSSGPACRQPR
jgi:hypothetical protein